MKNLQEEKESQFLIFNIDSFLGFTWRSVILFVCCCCNLMMFYDGRELNSPSVFALTLSNAAVLYCIIAMQLYCTVL